MNEDKVYVAVLWNNGVAMAFTHAGGWYRSALESVLPHLTAEQILAQSDANTRWEMWAPGCAPIIEVTKEQWAAWATREERQ